MDFISIPTEQTTAITDALIGLEAIFLAVYLQLLAPKNRERARYWQTLIIFTALASFTGAAAHGIQMSKSTYELLWKPLLLLLGLVVAQLAICTVYDLFGAETAKRSRSWFWVVAVGFFAAVHLPGTTFFIFILYEAAGMLFALVSYLWIARQRRLRGAGIIALGIILQLAAAAAQACGPYEFKVVWIFDHNGLFHLIGIVATFTMILGASKGFFADKD